MAGTPVPAVVPTPPSALADRDVIGEMQEHVIVYAKAVADAIWEVQQMRAFDGERVAALAAHLRGVADTLDGPGGLIDALPDFPRDPA